MLTYSCVGRGRPSERHPGAALDLQLQGGRMAATNHGGSSDHGQDGDKTRKFNVHHGYQPLHQVTPGTPPHLMGQWCGDLKLSASDRATRATERQTAGAPCHAMLCHAMGCNQSFLKREGTCRNVLSSKNNLKTFSISPAGQGT